MKKIARKATRKPEVSIIVPARNEEDYIGECISSLLSQDFTDFEVIVVNDGSSDKTPQIVNAFCARDKRVKLHNFDQGHSAAFARNFGAKNARGSILVFHDADTYADPHFISQVVGTMASNKLDGMANKTVAGNPRTFIGKCIAAQRSALADTLQNEQVRITEPPIALLGSYTREAFEALGGYNQGIFYFEDADLTHRFIAKGFKAVYNPKAVEYHHDPETLEETMRQSRWFGKGIAYNIRVKGLGAAKSLAEPLYSATLTLLLLILIASFFLGITALAAPTAMLFAALLLPLAGFAAYLTVKSGDLVHSVGFTLLFWARNNVKLLAAAKALIQNKKL